MTDAQKKASAKWTKNNMTFIGCKIRKEKAERFRQACRERGTTANAELIKFIDGFIDEPSIMD